MDANLVENVKNLKVSLMTLKRNKIKLGRHYSFQNEKELEEVISDYFKYCQHERIFPGKIGLINHLGISKKTYYNYLSEEHPYCDVMERALVAIEAFNENLLYHDKTHKGAKFNLEQQFGWNQGQKNHNINENVDIPYEEYLKGMNTSDY